MEKLNIIFCTVPVAKAVSLSTTLVSQKVAACVNIVNNVRSIYQWEGKICDDTEALLIIKTPHNLCEQLFAVIKKEHPYDVPEIISLTATEVADSYLQWAITSTSEKNYTA
jgi:periplasmic divalent cation tolerance protein